MMAADRPWKTLKKRLPAGLREVAPIKSTRRTLGRVLAATAVVLLFGVGAWVYVDRPTEISDIALSGPRSPVPIDVVILLDESGSFDAYANARKATIEQLAVWAPQNLRPDDTVTVVSFASGAAIRLPLTPVSGLQQAQFDQDVEFEMLGTAIVPALTLAASLGSGHNRALIAVTDTDIAAANPAVVERLITETNATSLSAVMPNGESTRAQWLELFPWGEEFWADPNSANEVSLALGKALAHATGQQVTKAEH